jgi:hypothetical protein
LRSKFLAMHALWGHYTIGINLSPSEIGAEWTFRVAECEYK